MLSASFETASGACGHARLQSEREHSHVVPWHSRISDPTRTDAPRTGRAPRVGQWGDSWAPTVGETCERRSWGPGGDPGEGGSGWERSDVFGQLLCDPGGRARAWTRCGKTSPATESARRRDVRHVRGAAAALYCDDTEDTVRRRRAGDSERASVQCSAARQASQREREIESCSDTRARGGRACWEHGGWGSGLVSRCRWRFQLRLDERPTDPERSAAGLRIPRHLPPPSPSNLLVSLPPSSPRPLPRPRRRRQPPRGLSSSFTSLLHNPPHGFSFPVFTPLPRAPPEPGSQLRSDSLCPAPDAIPPSQPPADHGSLLRRVALLGHFAAAEHLFRTP